jgi:tubulin beta
MGTKFLDVVCDDNGIGGGGEYCGDNAAQLDRISVLYREASGGKYFPRALLLDLEHGVTDTATDSKSPLGENFRLVNLVNQNADAGNNWVKAR